MTHLIIRLFVRDYKSRNNPKVRLSYGKVAGIVGIVTNLLLSCAKILTGIFSGSIAILGDGINNLTDCTSSAVPMIGFRIYSKPADRDHPFGHARMEYISGLVVSVVILLLGADTFRSAIEEALSYTEASLNIITVIVLSGSILVKIWQFFFYRKVGKLIDSATVKATSRDSFNDVIATSVVLAGSIVSVCIGYNLDCWLGMAVSLFIMFSGFQLIRETVTPLLGRPPKKECIDKLETIFKDTEGILGYHDLTIHDYGDLRIFATVHLEMDSRISLEESHRICDDLERRVRETTGISLLSHPDPIDITDKRIAYLKGRIEKELGSISSELKIHDFHVEWGYESIVSFDLQAPFSLKITDENLKKSAEKVVTDIGSRLIPRIIVDRT